MKRLGLLLLTLAAGLGGQLSQPAAALPPADVASATERAPALRMAYLVGLDIHLPSGRVVRVPIRSRDRSTTLLGRTDRGWVVEAGNTYYLVANGTATRFGRAPTPETVFPTKSQLSDDGRYVVHSKSDHFTYVTALDLDGNTVDSFSLGDDLGDVEDAAGDKIYVGAYDALYERTIGERRRKVARRSPGLVSIEHDTVFLGSPGGPSGPTSLSDPGAVPWRTESHPLSLSPNATYVAGNAGPGKVVVLRMRDGKPMRTWSGVCWNCFDEMAWESERFFLFATWNHEGTRQALKRCDVRTGRCRQATPWSRLRYSLPESEHYVQSYPPGFIS